MYICIRLQAVIDNAKEDTEMFTSTITYTKPLQFLSKYNGVELATDAVVDLTKKADKHVHDFKEVVAPLLRMNASQFMAPPQTPCKRQKKQ